MKMGKGLPSGKKIPKIDAPDVAEGVAGLRFLETVLAASKAKAKWTKMKV